MPSGSAMSLRTKAVEHSLARNSRAEAFSCCCSSLSPKSIASPRGLRFRAGAREIPGRAQNNKSLAGFGHFEAAFGDDVFLDVRGTAADHQAEREHPFVGPIGSVHRVTVAAREH